MRALALRRTLGLFVCCIAFATLHSASSAPLSSDTTGCAPGSRCISVNQNGQPSPSGDSVAQCRGTFPDFIVPKDTIPANYGGPWFRPELIEGATTDGPSTPRPWLSIDPTISANRLSYLLILRNYAFSSRDVRAVTPQLTADSDYVDPSVGDIDAALRAQRWYPAPRMTYGTPSRPGTREAAYGMTRERTITTLGELGGNVKSFANYAVAYYDARGAHTYQQVWSTTTPGTDIPNRSAMTIADGGFVFKLLFSAADEQAFQPQDILQGSVAARIVPGGGQTVPVRLLQMDIAVKDGRSGPTGWYFATYAYDHSVPATSPWLRMVPVGLMWGNDPGGLPLTQSWINPNAPLYARRHLGVDDRLNGPVDNPDSACMSCHSTAQAPAVADMMPRDTCDQPPFRANWFRNLPGSQAFGRFTATASTCVTTTPSNAPAAADYSLQLASTVSRALATAGTAATFNPCTWDTASPPPPAPPTGQQAPIGGAPRFPLAADEAPVYEVSRE